MVRVIERISLLAGCCGPVDRSSALRWRWSCALRWRWNRALRWRWSCCFWRCCGLMAGGYCIGAAVDHTIVRTMRSRRGSAGAVATGWAGGRPSPQEEEAAPRRGAGQFIAETPIATGSDLMRRFVPRHRGRLARSRRPCLCRQKFWNRRGVRHGRWFGDLFVSQSVKCRTKPIDFRQQEIQRCTLGNAGIFEASHKHRRPGCVHKPDFPGLTGDATKARRQARFWP